MDERLVRGDQTAFYSVMRKKCINNKDFSDVVFLVGPQRQVVYGHRCLLAARSDVFKNIFSQMPTQGSVSRESPIGLAELRPEVFLTALDYIYTNCCTLTSDLAPDVLSLAMEYNLDGLRKLSVRFLLDGMDVETACDVLQSAVVHAQPDLLQKSLDYSMKHGSEVLKSNRLQDLSPESLGALLRGDALEADELEVLSAIRRWARSNAMASGRQMKDVSSSVIPLVRLPLLSAEELSKVEEENKKDMVIPMQQLAAAWRFHALKENTPMSYSTTLRSGTVPRSSHKYLPKEK